MNKVKSFVTTLCVLLLALVTLNVFAGPTRAGDASPPARNGHVVNPMLLTTTTPEAGMQAVFDGAVYHIGVWRNTIVDDDGDVYYAAYVSVDVANNLGGTTNVGFNLGSGRADLWTHQQIE